MLGLSYFIRYFRCNYNPMIESVYTLIEKEKEQARLEKEEKEKQKYNNLILAIIDKVRHEAD